jgi:hypothetical protein
MLNTHLLTGRARSKAVADYGFLGWAVLEKLVNQDVCETLVGQAEQLVFDPIFNEETKSRKARAAPKKDPRARAAAKGGQLADDVLHSVHCLLKDMLIISDAHIWGLGRGATFLRTPPGCFEQVPVLPRRGLLFPNPGAGTPSGLLPLQDDCKERVCRAQTPALLGSYCFARPFWIEIV